MEVDERLSSFNLTRALISSFLAIAGCCTATAQTSLAPKAIVEGMVIDSVTRQPLRKARVSMENRQRSQGAYETRTDAAGRFVFDSVDPGEYLFVARKLGYLEVPPGSDPDPGKAFLRVSAGDDLKSVQLSLVPQGVIAGRVVDEDGDPCEQCSGGIFRVVWRHGQREQQFIESGTLEGMAEFYYAGLKTGRYYIYAQSDERLDNSRGGGHNGFVPTYYPSALDFENAVPIDLTAGQQMLDLEIKLRQAAVYSIRGKVVGLEPQPDEPGAGRFVILKRLRNLDIGDPVSGRLDSDGLFNIDGVQPGSYELSVIESRSGLHRANEFVGVSDRDIDGFVIQTLPLLSLSGKVRMEGDGKFDATALTIALRNQKGDYPGYPVRPKAEGTFTFPRLGADKLTLVVFNGLPKGAYLKSVSVNGTASSDDTVDLTSGAGGQLEVLLARDGGLIRGRVDAADPSSGGHGTTAQPKNWQVVLVPDSSSDAIRSLRSKTASVNQYGEFTLEGIAPGDYKLYASEIGEDDAWSDPAFLAQLNSEATMLSVKPNSTAQMQLHLIPAQTIKTALVKAGIQ